MLMKTTVNIPEIGELNHLLGKYLKALRKEHHLSQARLASKLGISRATLANYESGRAAPPYWLIAQIAAYFQTDALQTILTNTFQKQEKPLSTPIPEPMNLSAKREDK